MRGCFWGGRRGGGGWWGGIGKEGGREGGRDGEREREIVGVWVSLRLCVCECLGVCVFVGVGVGVCMCIFNVFDRSPFLLSFNRHQGMWMATREQVYHLDERCNSRFFNVNGETAVWVEVGLEGGSEEGGRERDCSEIRFSRIFTLHTHTCIQINHHMDDTTVLERRITGTLSEGGREEGREEGCFSRRYICSFSLFDSHVYTPPFSPSLPSSGWTAKE